MAIVVVALQGACHGASDMPATVTQRNIRALKVGMTEAEVTAILGPPLEVQGPAVICWVDGGQCHAVQPLDWRTWTYSRKVRTATWFPMLWVHFAGGKVREVYAKRYFLADSEGVYVLDESKAWSLPEFEKTFPP